MKLVVTNYTGDRQNWGCQATSRELLRFLGEAVSSWHDISITTVPLPAPHDFDRHVEAVHGSRLRRIYGDPHPSADAICFVETLARERFGNACDSLAGADAVVFQGEGTIGPTSMYRSLRLFALPFLAVHLYRKPVLSMNQSLYAIDDSDAALLRTIFSTFGLVAVREAASYQFARRIGLDQAVLCPDFAFRQSEAPPAQILNNEAEYFCITGSAARRFPAPEMLGWVLRRTTEIYGLQPIFLSSRAKDLKELGELLIGVPEARMLSSSEISDSAQLSTILAAARFVIGGRYHTAITALTQGTPAVLLPGNTHKNEGIAPMLGLPLDVFGGGDEDAIIARIDDIITGRCLGKAEIRAALKDLLPIYAAFEQFFAATLGSVCHGNGVLPPAPACLTPPFGGTGTETPHEEVYRRSNRRRGYSVSLFHRFALHRIRKRSSLPSELHRTLIDLP